jgi:hypothetical protein
MDDVERRKRRAEKACRELDSQIERARELVRTYRILLGSHHVAADPPVSERFAAGGKAR